MGRYREYEGEGGSGRAYYSGKTADSPPVIVLHEVWGFTPFIREACDALGEAGFAAVAPLLFWRHQDLFNATAIKAAMASAWDLPLKDRFIPEQLGPFLSAKRAPKEVRSLLTILYDRGFRAELLEDQVSLLRSLSGDDRSVGVLGFSMGGGLAYRLAGESAVVKACIAFSADPPGKDLIGRISSPILAFYGSEDTFTNRHVPRFVEDVLRLNKGLTLTVYPAAGHEFFDTRNSEGYRSNAAADSWRRTLAFLRRNLK